MMVKNVKRFFVICVLSVSVSCLSSVAKGSSAIFYSCDECSILALFLILVKNI